MTLLATTYMLLSIYGLFAYMQGEKGEPGFTMVADGAMMSGLAGPIGPKGVKVLFLFSTFIYILLSYDRRVPQDLSISSNVSSFSG